MLTFINKDPHISKNDFHIHFSIMIKSILRYKIVISRELLLDKLLI